MEFRILGALEVIAAARRVEIGAAKERSLLAQLVLRANTTVSRDRLVEVVWGDDPPASAATTLNTYVSHLRTALGGGPGRERGRVLVTRPPGYALVIDGDQVDALRFERLVAEGRRSLAAGDACAAADTFTRGLELWRGAALAEFQFESWARAEAARLEELRITASEDRLDANLASGQSHELVGELRRLVSEHPLRERLWSQLMLALYRCGRQSEALRSFTELRRMLSEELGIEPSPPLRQLEQDILHHRSALVVPSALAPRLEASKATPRVPLAGPLSAKQDLHLHGRSREFDILARCWERARAGQRQVVLIGGEPGIGKSRLVTDFAASAHGQGATALYGRCEEELGVPYQPFIEALRHYVLNCPQAELAGLMDTDGSELARLVPSLARRIPDLPSRRPIDSETERFRLFEAVGSTLAAAARASPVVLVLDDLQWASTPTLLLLKHLLGTTHAIALLVIGTYRDSELRADHPLAELLADAWREPGVERIGLGGLMAEDVVALVGDAAGGTLDHSATTLAHAIGEDTGGNPFYLIEVVRHLVETGAVRPSETGWTDARETTATRLPDSVREVIARRVGRLPERSRQALTVGAVSGPAFSLELVAGVMEVPEDETLEAIENAASVGLISEVPGRIGWFAFRHALLRDALRGEVGVTRRARLHRQVAETMERVAPSEPGPHLAELAEHWFEAGRAGEVVKAVSYARRAGDWALANLAYEEATAHYRRALDRLVPGDRAREELHCDLLLALGDAQRRSADTAYRATMEAAAEHARRLDEPERVAMAALGSSRSFSWCVSVGHVDEPLVGLYEEALAVLPEGDSVLRARVMAQLAVELHYKSSAGERRGLLGREALGIIRRTNDRAGLASVLAPAIVAMWDPTTLAERLAWADELYGLAAELHSKEVAAQASFLRGGCRLEAGDVEGARGRFRDGNDPGRRVARAVLHVDGPVEADDGGDPRRPARPGDGVSGSDVRHRPARGTA